MPYFSEPLHVTAVHTLIRDHAHGRQGHTPPTAGHPTAGHPHIAHDQGQYKHTALEMTHTHTSICCHHC